MGRAHETFVFIKTDMGFKRLINMALAAQL